MKHLKDYISEAQRFPVEYDNAHRTIHYHCTNDSDWKKISKDFKEFDTDNKDNTISIDYLKNDIYADIDGKNYRYRVPREFDNYYATDTDLEVPDLNALPKNPTDNDKLEKEIKELICRVFNSMPEPLF